MRVRCGRDRVHFRRQRVNGVRVPRQLVHLALDAHHLQRLRALQPLRRLQRLALNLPLHHALDVRNLQHPRAQAADLVLDVVALRQQRAVHGVVQRPSAISGVRSHVLGADEHLWRGTAERHAGHGRGTAGEVLASEAGIGGDGYALDTHVGGHVDGVPSGQWVSNVPMFLVFGSRHQR